MQHALRCAVALVAGMAIAPQSPAAAQAPQVNQVRAKTLTAPPAIGSQKNETALAKIPERMEQFVADGVISGAVTLVAHHGEVLQTAAVGKADIGSDRPMRTESLFAIASMTKPVTATAMMILKDEGKLKIDDPVSKYIPEFADATLKGGKKPSRPITLRDLMTHTAGLGGDQRLEGSLEETTKALAKRPLDFESGAKWQYSPGLTVCGRVVEVASGQPFEGFLAERIFEPLGMKDTTFVLTEELQPRRATLYKLSENGKELQPAEHWLNGPAEAKTRGPNPSGGLFSTASDMGRFYQMVLNGGELDGKRIVSKESVEEMTSVQTPDLTTGFTPGNGWGLGWCVVREPQGVTEMLSPGSFGHGGAFGTQGWIDSERKMIFVLMIQRAGLPNSDASDMRKEFQRLAAEAVTK
ncbi:MAG: beta-lactamase family protein [Planctomycetota bacterium]|nr:beta-lactamase family protein [Planctomycetaceae bacterium]MDQ3329184.1 beta-lactamase family protein [Planctomycetota bacterium]